jgi:hypothetical protein
MNPFPNRAGRPSRARAPRARVHGRGAAGRGIDASRALPRDRGRQNPQAHARRGGGGANVGTKTEKLPAGAPRAALFALPQIEQEGRWRAIRAGDRRADLSRAKAAKAALAKRKEEKYAKA